MHVWNIGHFYTVLVGETKKEKYMRGWEFQGTGYQRADWIEIIKNKDQWRAVESTVVYMH